MAHFSGSVAAKIMEKLGYKEGAGLGKNQQGMSMALQVEKTSKRGGKILHEKDILKSKCLPVRWSLFALLRVVSDATSLSFQWRQKNRSQKPQPMSTC